MADHLVQLRRKWYAVLDVPKDLRPALGRSRFKKSCGTDSRSVAIPRAARLVAIWKTKIVKARAELTGVRDDVEREALYWRSVMARAVDDDERELVKSHIVDIAMGMDQRGRGEEAVKFSDMAQGRLVRTDDHLDEWAATLDVTPKVKAQRIIYVRRLARQFVTLDLITRKSVTAWAVELITVQGTKRTSVTRMMSDLRGYWRYLQAIDVVDDGLYPFDKLGLPGVGTGKAKAKPKEPWTADEVLALLERTLVKGDEQLADLIRLGMWTGARQGDLCKLKVADVHGDHFDVADAKTPAGVRSVPIHPELRQTIARLVDSSKDGFILSGLVLDQHGGRSSKIGSRFGRLKASMGFGRGKDFHSIRRTVITLFEAAGVPEPTVAAIVGHKHPTMTFGLYSGGPTLEQKTEAMKALAYR